MVFKNDEASIKNITMESNNTAAVISVNCSLIAYTYLCSVRALTSDGGYGFSDSFNFTVEAVG